MFLQIQEPCVHMHDYRFIRTWSHHRRYLHAWLNMFDSDEFNKLVMWRDCDTHTTNSACQQALMSRRSPNKFANMATVKFELEPQKYQKGPKALSLDGWNLDQETWSLDHNNSDYWADRVSHWRSISWQNTQSQRRNKSNLSESNGNASVTAKSGSRRCLSDKSQ